MSTFDYLTPAEAVAAAQDSAPEYKRITGLNGVDADRIPNLIPEEPWRAHGHLDKFKEIARVVWAEDADPGTAEVFYTDGTTDFIGRQDLLCVERPIATADKGDKKQGHSGEIESTGQTLAQLLSVDGVTLTSEHIATGTDGDGWEHHEYRVTLTHDGRTYTQTVLHGIGIEEVPELVETVGMLVSQSMTAYSAESYEEWASDFSSDPDEWMPRKTYDENVKMAEDLRALFGEERYERYATADRDA